MEIPERHCLDMILEADLAAATDVPNRGLSRLEVLLNPTRHCLADSVLIWQDIESGPRKPKTSEKPAIHFIL